ncbi:UNVERIFIED_CONTAM: hypothetical protein BEN50_17030 [Euhalothece sp. KZN 001]
MFEEIVSAIEQQDYTTAKQLITNRQHQFPDHPWLIFYTARVKEAEGELETAQKTYQSLLRECSNRKLLSQARERLLQLKTSQQQQQEEKITQALAQPGGKEIAVFILSAIPSENKKAAAQTLANTFQLDPYNARLQLPSRGWRLFRVGAMGELLYYSKILQQADIPCFCTALSSLDTLNVFQVQYFKSEGDQVTARCATSNGQEGSLTFNWSEVKAKVQGRVPIFEQVVTTDARRKLKRKSGTLDYVQFYDLHLPERSTVLRLCDQKYQFQQSFSLSENIQKGETLRRNWLELLNYLEEKIPDVNCWDDFTPFGEGAIEFPQMLRRISSHINLKRRYDTSWDAAFHLYSGLVFFVN